MAIALQKNYLLTLQYPSTLINYLDSTEVAPVKPPYRILSALRLPSLSQNASNYHLNPTEVVPVKRFCIVGEQY
jgi:hypothetical protein